MHDETPRLLAEYLRGSPKFTPEPGVGVLLLHRRDSPGRTVRLAWDQALEAYRMGGVRALTFEAWKALNRDDRVEFEELRRSLATSEGVVPVAVARRYAALSADETRTACADFVWQRGTDTAMGDAARPPLCQAGSDLLKLRLPTDTEG